MKIYRFEHEGRIRSGILREDGLVPARGSIFDDFVPEREPVPIGAVKLLAPVEPSKIVAVGRNYKDHAAEMGHPLPEEPLLFLKPSTAVIGPHEAILYPEMSGRVDFEGELAVVMKRRTYRLDDEAEAAESILGYTCLNDVTARDLQEKDKQFTRAKSFDTFAAVGPCIATDLDPAGLEIKTFLNGKLRQSSNTRHLIFSVPFLVRFISRIMTLLPGDVPGRGGAHAAGGPGGHPNRGHRDAVEFRAQDPVS